MRARTKKPFNSRAASPTLRRLFVEMDELEMYQCQLAKKIGTSQSRVAAWRSGINEPGIMTVEAFADALGMEIIVRRKT